MNSFLFAGLIALLCALTIVHGRTIPDAEPDNSIEITNTNNNNNNDGGSNRFYEANDWVKISQAPPKHVSQVFGTSLELECEVAGSPPPTIEWIKGDTPISNMDNYESNLISEASSSAIVKVRSRLIIDHMVPNDSSFTCVGRSGSKTAYETTLVHTKPGSGHYLKPHNLTELLAMNTNLFSGPKRPRIVLYNSVVMEIIGTNIMLPCKTMGRPRPEVYWMDSDLNVISGQDSHYKILPNGDLLINDLKWSDMGLYTCVARNALGKDKSATFIYPLRSSD